MPPRPRVEPTDDWHQIALVARAPGQCSYVLIRPVVLFGQSPADRVAETGAAERTLYRQVAPIAPLDLAGLFPPPKIEKHRTLPPEVRQASLDAKLEHPPLNVHELTTICWTPRYDVLDTYVQSSRQRIVNGSGRTGWLHPPQTRGQSPP